jgi:hypothetical protein
VSEEIQIQNEFSSSLADLSNSEVCRDARLDAAPPVLLLNIEEWEDALEVERTFTAIDSSYRRKPPAEELDQVFMKSSVSLSGARPTDKVVLRGKFVALR